MDTVILSFNSFAAHAAALLVSSIWQSLVLVAAVAVVLRVASGLSAAFRSAIWSTVLVLVAAVPIVMAALPQAAGASGDGAGILHVHRSWSTAFFVAWAALTAYRLGELVLSALRLGSLIKQSVPIEPRASVVPLLRQGRRRVLLCESAEVLRPCLVGFWKARILLPTGLVQQLGEDDLRRVVLHEMEHLRRRDVWVNLVQKVLLAFFPLHPVLLWLDRTVSLHRELACDDGVLRQASARKAYAACLTRLTESQAARAFGRTCELALGALGARGRQPELVRRVRRILAGPETHMPAGKARMAAGALVAGVLVAGGYLARSPQLVSFSAASADVSQARASTAPPTVALLQHDAASHATLVKATFPVEAARPRSKGPSLRRQSVSMNSERHAALKSSPRVMMTSWRRESVWMPRLVPVTWTLETISEEPRPGYAAVATRDGWLIVQL